MLFRSSIASLSTDAKTIDPPPASRPCAAAGALALGGGVAAIAQALVAPGPNNVAFPADWAKGTMYGTVDRPDTKQYRGLYTSAESLAAVRAGKPIPDGTVLTLAAYMAQVDANGVPLKDANGRFIKGNLAAVNVMQKGKGWGEDIPAAVRNGDWVYQPKPAEPEPNR